MAFRHGTICVPFATVESSDGLNASPEKTQSVLSESSARSSLILVTNLAALVGVGVGVRRGRCSNMMIVKLYRF
jgi:hypothetical protein